MHRPWPIEQEVRPNPATHSVPACVTDSHSSFSQVMDTRIHLIIPTRQYNFAILVTFTLFGIRTKNFATSATEIQPSMSTFIHSLKIPNGSPTSEPFSLRHGKPLTGYTFGECQSCYTAVMDGIEPAKYRHLHNSYWTPIIAHNTDSAPWSRRISWVLDTPSICDVRTEKDEVKLPLLNRQAMMKGKSPPFFCNSWTACIKSCSCSPNASNSTRNTSWN